MIDITAFGVYAADMAHSAGTHQAATAAAAHRSIDAVTDASVDRGSI